MAKFYKAAPEQDVFQYHEAATAAAKKALLDKKSAKTAAKLAKLEKKTAKVKAVLADAPLTAKAKTKILFTKSEVQEITGLAIKEAISAAKDVGIKLKKKDLEGYISNHLVLQAVDQATKAFIEEGDVLEAGLVAGVVAGKVLGQMAEDTDNRSLKSACLIATSRAILESNAKKSVKQEVATGVIEVIAAGLIGRKVDLPSVSQAADIMVAEGRLSIESVLVAAMKDLEEGLLQLSEDEELKLRLQAKVYGIEVVTEQEPEEVELNEASSDAKAVIAEVDPAPALVPGSFKIL